MYFLILIAGLLFIFYCYGWFLIKQKMVISGNARPEFPYTRYTEDELNKMYPQYSNENVPTRQTPEQTYTKFIEALKKGDLEEIMVNFSGKKYQEYKSSFDDDIKNNKLIENIKLFDRKLILKSDLETLKSYYLEGLSKEFFIEFVKQSDGDFKIESL